MYELLDSFDWCIIMFQHMDIDRLYSDYTRVHVNNTMHMSRVILVFKQQKQQRRIEKGNMKETKSKKKGNKVEHNKN